MSINGKVLIIDDSVVNRTILNKILSDDYSILQAENGKAGLEVLVAEKDSVSAILLDIIMPVMDGYSFLQTIKGIPSLADIPIIVTTQSNNDETELKAFSLGATDFITKPYKPEIIKRRLSNILQLRQASYMRNTLERDALTGLYNKETFYRKSSELIRQNLNRQYILICADIDRFKLVNDLFGMQEGDKLLRFVAREIRKFTNPSDSICGRISADIFAICTPQISSDTFQKFIQKAKSVFNDYPLDMTISMHFGIYTVEDPYMPVSGMCDRAALAIASIKGKYGEHIAHYDESHRRLLLEEQEITNSMHSALQDKQFIAIYQPKYNLITGKIIGAEALVRWQHPEKGLIPPCKFIDLFERNGFISSVDFYIWDLVCQNISKWKSLNIPILPISINVSRVDIYNLNLFTYLTSLLTKYSLTADMLELEITETAYTENPEQLISVIKQLKSAGFKIAMDDFGSGYSSLNMLSDVTFDVLKLNMHFMQSNSTDNRQSNILNFIVSLSKWLGLSVVVEGVETLEQVVYLRNLGYCKAQGYYFARPMSEDLFIQLLNTNMSVYVGIDENYFSPFVDLNEMWDPSSKFNMVFDNFVGALALYQYKDEKLSILRGNDKFFDMLGISRDILLGVNANVLQGLAEEERETFTQTIKELKKTNGEQAMDNRWKSLDYSNRIVWIHSRMKVVFNDGDSTIFLVSMEDITGRKQLEESLAVQSAQAEAERDFFEHLYDSVPCGIAQFSIVNKRPFLNANLAMIKLLGYQSKEEFSAQPRYFCDIVPKDYIPVLRKELEGIKNLQLDTPHILEYHILDKNGNLIWIQDSTQIVLDKMGEKIIQSVFTNATTKKEQMDMLSKQAMQDALTGIYNRNAFKSLTENILNKEADLKHAFIILDIDNFKNANDLYGHQFGDEVLIKVSSAIKSTFRSTDFFCRLGGDEFAIFLHNVPSDKLVLELCEKLKNIVCSLTFLESFFITCSIGIATTDSDAKTFEILYKNADIALYNAKNDGKNRCSIY